MGLSTEQYAAFTWFNYHLKCKGYRAKRLDEWKQTRQLAFITMLSSANADPKKIGHLTPETWWPMGEAELKEKKIIPVYKRRDFKAFLERVKNAKR